MCDVTVIVPVYNTAKYLRECLDSLLSQTLQNLEILCINDGSTDSSLQILQEYAAADPRLRMIDKQNAGYGHTINLGLRQARGEYIGIVESDDYVKRRMFATLLHYAKRYDLDFVKSDFHYFIGERPERQRSRTAICPRLHWYYRRLNPAATPALLDAEMMNVTGIYRRSFLTNAKIQLRETPGAAFQDTGFWVQVFSAAKSCMFLPLSFYQIRRDNPGSSVFNSQKMLLVCDEYDAAHSLLLRRRQEAFLPFLFKRRVFSYKFFLSYMDPRDTERFLERFSQDITQAENGGYFNRALFTKPMLHYLEAIRIWSRGQPAPVYQTSSNPVCKLSDCVKEHGLPFTINTILEKTKIRRKVF